MRKFLKNKLGLSLVELVVTITIMAILAAWLIPSLISSKQDSDIKMDKSAVESLQSAIHIASQDSEVYTKAKILADSSSNNQIKLVYIPNAEGVLEFNAAYVKDGSKTLSSKDPAGEMLRELKTDIDNRVNSTMDPVVLKTADAKALQYCFIITFPDVKFKTNVEFYAAPADEVSSYWEDVGEEDVIPTTPDDLPDITEPTDPPPPPPPAKQPGEVTKHPVAKSGLVYTGNPQELIVPGSGTGTLYYSIQAADSGFSTEIPSGTNAGTYTVWYYAAPYGNYEQSKTYSITVVIDKANYNIVPPTAQAPVFDGKAHTLINAGSSKYGKMEYKLEGGAWGTALPAATNIGTYKIYYYGTGDANHHPTSKDAYITATIAPSKTATYAISNYTYNAMKHTGVVGENIDIITGTNTATNVGVYTVQIKPKTNFTWADGKNNTLTLTWEISRAKGTCIAPSIKTLNYTGSSQTLINPASNGTGTIYYKVNNGAWSTTVPSAKEAGSYTIYYKMDATQNYTGIDETLVGTATIGKVNPTVTAPTAKTNLKYTGSKQTLINAGSTNGGTLKYSLDNSTYSTSLPQGLSAGTYTVWYYVEGNANFNTTSKQSIQVTIAQITPTYTAPKAKTLFYNGAAQQLITAGSNTTPGSFGYKISTDSGYSSSATNIKGTDAKVYTINWKFTPTDTTNYMSAGGSFTVTIQANGLKFNPSGGTVTISKGYPNNSKTTSLPVPTKSGATFQKWVYDTSSQHLVLDTQFKYTGKISVHIEAYMDIWDNTDGKRLLSCTNNSGWNFQANGNKITTYFWDNGASAYRQALSSRDWASLSPGWHSFDLIFDGTYGYLYIDGVCEGKTAAFTGTLGYPDADNNIIIGAEADGAPKSVQSGIPLFQGKIANVMINNDSTRITSNNCFVVPMSGVTTLIAEWKSAGSCTAPTVKNLTYNGSAQQLINPAKNATGTVYYKIGENGTWSTSVPTATNVGSYKIYYCVAPSATHTEVKETLVGTATITTATVSITAPTAKTLTYNGSAQTLINAGATSGGTMKYSTSENGTYSTTLPTGTNAGTYTVWYYVDGGSNFATTSKQSISVTIKKVTPSVTAPTAKSLAYTGSSQALVNAGKTNYGTMKYSLSENGTYSTTIPTGTNAGGYTVWYYVEGNSNVNTTAKKSVSVTIGKINPTVTAPTAKTGLKYNGSNQQLVNAGSTNGGTMMYSTSENGSYSTVIPTGKNAGTYTVWWYVNGGTSYNSTAKRSISITISKGTPSYTAPKAKSGLTYNNTAQKLITAGSSTTAGTFTYKLSSASTYSTTIPTGIAATTYTVNWKFTPTDTSNYNSASGSITVTIGGSPAVNKAYTFNYTGGIQTFTAPIAGYYNLEVWGAQGGRSLADGVIKDTGGYGGYSSGDVYLETGQTIYIAIGGKGADPVSGQDSAGGWNGGGNSTHDHSDNEVAGAGGGATSITLTKRSDGQLKNYASYKTDVLIVAGGGGGGEWNYTDSAGVGGGLKGGLGRGCLNMSAASQTSGYAFGQGGAGTWNSSWGANAAADGLAGGGGGYYGGYGSSSNDNYASTGGPTSSAGGGSAYIDGVLNGITMSGVQSGNGKAVITYRGDTKPNSGTSGSTPTVQTFNYTGSKQTFTAPVAGYYFIETWGAQGGSMYGTGGYGGYSTGYVYLNKGETLNVYVGQQPSGTTGGWNGGGSGNSSGSASVYYSAGGGASDVRKGGTALSNRIIVAGGGGGGAYYSTDILGGTGGGLTTGNVYYANYGGVMTKSGNIGATVNNGGTAAVDGAAPGGYMPGVTSGSLGQGSPASGGGYYGGPYYTCGNRVYGGGGGSGYIGGVINGFSAAGVNEGHGKVTITLSQDSGAPLLPNTRWTYNYTGGAQTFVVPVSGYYNLYAYGARGGSSVNNGDSSMLGYGGMMRGVIWLEKGQVLYIYVGEAGSYSTGNSETGGTYAHATFNGGGDGGSRMINGPSAGYHLGGSGGGATDFRLVGGAWNNPEGLKSRILVAGGGGGQGCASSHNRGHGGGTTTTNTGYYYGASSTGGTQTAGGYGKGTVSTDGGASYWACDTVSGGFGYGANAAQCGAGGGGGWYGGGSGYTSGGGGGSSFCAGISGYTTDYSEYRNGLKFVQYGILTGVQNGHGQAVIYYLGETY